MLFANFSTRSRRNDRNTDVAPDFPPAIVIVTADAR
jgi:hypothetical protein